MTESHDLLIEYVRNGNESAFKELVVRYLDLVYSTALRKLGGDTHLAKDVAQTVFLHLARKAPQLSRSVMLGGWLHRATCNVAASFARTERRRQARERLAVQMNTLANNSAGSLDLLAPVLDDAIGQLQQEDRTAILLRFFERRDFRSVGVVLGSSEDAARMRVSRALEKLHILLKRKGFTISVAALSAGLAAEAVSAAPAGLAMSIAGSALAGAGGTGAVLTLIKILTMSKLKAGVLGALMVAGMATPLVISLQKQSRLVQENASLRQQVAQLPQMAAETERLSNQVAQAQSAQSLAQRQARELLRLRGELGTLRQQQKERERLQAAQISRPLPSDNAGPSTESVPRAAWAFVGYASPEAAMESVVWAMSQGDLKTLLAGVTPETRKLLAQQYGGKPESEIAASLIHETAGLKELPLRNKVVAADGTVTFRVAVEESDNGTVKTRDESLMSFENVGGEWKYSVLAAAGGANPDPTASQNQQPTDSPK